MGCTLHLQVHQNQLQVELELLFGSKQMKVLILAQIMTRLQHGVIKQDQMTLFDLQQQDQHFKMNQMIN